ncbi:MULTISPECIES: porin family protein [unclassified Arcicella]|uniref:porin family protein n=1 Tax=unclassified Arcicella TaxID=2644986 RepID=UPI00285695AE|nr:MULTISPECIES: porin family protein [unclassified Arcicella]MDR6565003.1 opacity protein-like surface antigen [Arcicella sp. BE51]MDR6814818.1 opacity protein-like surface antigen [Arcicella sp. BE140]MDR6826264.1 opacity protein-like surface antigen [Arcicella sp. BE139]
MNKKTGLFIVAILLVASLSKAQNLSFGPMAGVNFSNLSSNDNTSTKTGLAAGAFFNYSSKNWFGVGVQVLYNELGAKVKNVDNSINLNYLQVPVLFTYYFAGENTAGSFRPKLFVGPHVNFLLNAKDKNGIDLNPNGQNFSSTDFGVTVGGGFNYALADQIWLNVDARYGLGLTDATKSTTSNSMNRNLGINVGVSFPIGNL